MKIELHKQDKRGNIFRLLEEHTFTWRGKSYTIPVGFESDGVSVPRFLWAIVSPKIDPTTLRAGVEHDYLYREQLKGISRHSADILFVCRCLEDGLSFNKCIKAYTGLSLFGWVAWLQNKKLLEKKEK